MRLMPPVSDDRLSISLLTREYPPSIYGGAGVHVAQLVPQLRKLIDVDVQCMGEPREWALTTCGMLYSRPLK